MDDFWNDAEVISAYTRSQAIADGVLRDAGELAKEAGFRFTVALTSDAWADAVAWSKENGACQDETGRLWDVLTMARHAATAPRGQHADESPRRAFSVYRVPNVPDATEATLLGLELHIGPGDNAEPVLTIGLPGED